MPTLLRIRRRATRPQAEALDRSLSHVRLLAGLAGAVLSAWSLQRDPSALALVGLVACLIVCVLAPGERLLRRSIAVGTLSALMTAVDTVLVLVVLWLNGVEPGDPASLLLVLPLIEAGIRHGSFGVIVTWTTIALSMFGELAITWSGAPEQAKDPMKAAMILLVVGLPAGRFAEHLALRTHIADQLAADAANRAELLMQVFEGAAELTVVHGEARDARLTAIAGRLLSGVGSIEDAADMAGETGETASAVPDVASHAGRARVNPTAVGAAVRVELGGTPSRVLHVATIGVPDSRLVEALELLVANYRTHGSFVQRTASHSEPAHHQAAAEVDVAAEPVENSPAGRTIEDLIADRTPPDQVLDRPELDAHLAALLREQNRGDVGLVVVSLDNLKLMNDLHGRSAGDRLIAATTRRLGGLDGPSDTTGGHIAVGWMGADDFVVVIERCDRGAPLLAEMTRQALAGPVDIGQFGSTLLHAGIGAAVASPGDDLTGPQLMREASAQMIADRRAQNRRFLEAADFDFHPGEPVDAVDVDKVVWT